MMETSKVIQVEEAFRIIEETIGKRKLETEKIPVRQSDGRILASDQFSLLDIPSFNKSAMDGYAIIDGDINDKYRVLETTAAGYSNSQKLIPGATIKVMTGAPVPDGTGRVVIVENAVINNGFVSFNDYGRDINICRKGEDVTKGQKIISAGKRLDIVDMANLIGCGVMDVEVVRRLRAAVVSTGDELVDSYEQLKYGKIMNTNGPLLAGLIKRYGFELTGEHWTPDNKEQMRNVIGKALDDSDIVIITGGVSAGDFDYVPDIMKSFGMTIHFSRLAVKPGKPMTFASGKNKYIFGLPGNPVSAFLAFHLYVLRAARILSSGRSDLKEINIRLDQDFTIRPSNRTLYIPCRINDNGRAETISYNGSAHLMALVNADGFIVIPQGVSSIKTDENVRFISINTRI
jgi:molybdopterin molybdotransferase